MAQKTYQITLTEKEVYLLWIIAAWCRKPFTSRLLLKLGKVIAHSPKRKIFDSRYERAIESRLIATGKWLEQYREKQESKTPIGEVRFGYGKKISKISKYSLTPSL